MSGNDLIARCSLPTAYFFTHASLINSSLSAKTPSRYRV